MIWGILKRNLRILDLRKLPNRIRRLGYRRMMLDLAARRQAWENFFFGIGEKPP
jgi:hypothetical protein